MKFDFILFQATVLCFNCVSSETTSTKKKKKKRQKVLKILYFFSNFGVWNFIILYKMIQLLETKNHISTHFFFNLLLESRSYIWLLTVEPDKRYLCVSI